MLPGTWLWIWDGRHLLTSGFATFVARLLTIPGQRGVLIKAADGIMTSGAFGPWEPALVANLRAAVPGLQVGLWTFCYGRGPTRLGTRHTVADELMALDWAIDRAMPDVVVLNIEQQVMQSPNPAQDVQALVAGAKGLFGGHVGVSSVWRWANLGQPWPFAAAIAGGVDFWTNQVYSEAWQPASGPFDFLAEAQALAGVHGGGRPDYPSLYASAPATAATMLQYGSRGIALGAMGIAWWSAQHLNADRWDGIRRVADLFAPLPDPNRVLELFYQAHAARLGAKRFRADLRRRGWGSGAVSQYPILVCDRGVVLVDNGAAVDVTARAIDDFETLNGSLLVRGGGPYPVLEAFRAAHVANFGSARPNYGPNDGCGTLHRPDWGGHVAAAYPVLVCNLGVLIEVNGNAVDVTARAMDDFQTLNEQHDTLVVF
jgi:hypothetical protein